MTREEAKEILTHNWTRVDNPNYSESELDEAFFMAIEALEKEEPPIIFRMNTFVRRDELKVIKRSLREEIPNAVVIPNYLEPVWSPPLIDIKPGAPQMGDEVMAQGVLSLIERDGDGTMNVELQNVKAIIKC